MANIKTSIVAASLAVLGTLSIHAQKKLEYGFRAGINLATQRGASETDAAGEKLESNLLTFRLLAGGYARLKIANRFSVQAEVDYIQKGTDYIYQGPGFAWLKEADLVLPETGSTASPKRRLRLDVTQHYIEVPILFNYIFLKNKLEVSLGPSIGILTGAQARGATRYYDDPDVKGQLIAGAYNNILEYDLEYNYFKDAAGYSRGTRSVNVRDNIYSTAAFAGAYYHYTADERAAKGKFFNAFDYAINVGLSYRTNGALRLGARWQYSLNDITNNEYDYSLQTPDPNAAVPNTRGIKRSDIDRNMGIQVFVSFGF